MESVDIEELHNNYVEALKDLIPQANRTCCSLFNYPCLATRRYRPRALRQGIDLPIR